MEKKLTLPILSIAIPTFNRASYLALNLSALDAELTQSLRERVEIIVSDNASTDRTAEVVNTAIERGLRIRFVRNAENIGSDANIAQVFNLATASYVLILGDDDVLTKGTLKSLVDTLEHETYGIICLKPYGYDKNLLTEKPPGHAADVIFTDAGDFLVAIGAYVTLISACVINKRMLTSIDARIFCGGHLVQVHLVIRAALLAERNLFRAEYSVACKRNNSGGYDFAKVFVEELGRIFDSYVSDGLSKIAIRKFENRMMLGYFPYYLLRERIGRSPRTKATYDTFRARFADRILFWVWLAPIMWLPRGFSILWGGFTVLIGRTVGGDFQRGISFLKDKFSSFT